MIFLRWMWRPSLSWEECTLFENSILSIKYHTTYWYWYWYWYWDKYHEYGEAMLATRYRSRCPLASPLTLSHDMGWSSRCCFAPLSVFGVHVGAVVFVHRFRPRRCVVGTSVYLTILRQDRGESPPRSSRQELTVVAWIPVACCSWLSFVLTACVCL